MPDIPEPFLWAGFVALVLGLVAFDLWMSARRDAPLTLPQAVRWSLLWIGLSILFGLGVWLFNDSDLAAQFFTAYLLEKALSVDNLFVFLLIFGRFRVPLEVQHRVLTWGILGALVMRAVMILAGIQLMRLWHPVIYLFGAFLIFTGARTLFSRKAKKGKGGEEDQDEKTAGGRLVGFIEKHLPFVRRYDGEHFFTVEDGRRVGTLLLVVLLVIEGTDVAFALDSIPAVLAVSDDPFIVFSSNILAILGLRALFFTVAALLEKLRYLRQGLGVILVVIGAKMCLTDLIPVPPLVSFALTILILVVTVLLSVFPHGRRRPVDV